jgi:hypothetical protein
MSDSLLTLADLVNINGAGISDAEITDIIAGAPVLAALAADGASDGTIHKYLKETGAPVVGFRDPDEGRDHSKSTDELVTINLKVIDASYHVIKVIADAYKKGADALIAREGIRHLRAAFALAEKQIFNGLDVKGFSSLISSLAYLGHPMVYNAGGATACTSVWMIRSTPDMANAVVIAGNDGKIEMDETFVQFIEDGSSPTKKLAAYMTPVEGWLGLQLGSAYSVARLANVDNGSYKLTDDLLSELFALFPEDQPPTMICMNKRSRKQLQQSRTAVNVTGQPAPWPTFWEDIPIISTSGILNTETAVTVTTTAAPTTTTTGGS